jgi:hypothetical protein
MNLAVQKALSIHEIFNSYVAVKNYFLSLPLDAPNYMQVYERVIELRSEYNNIKNL